MADVCVCVRGEQEKNGSYFKSKFNPTIQPSNLKFNYLRNECEKFQLKTQILGWMVGWLDSLTTFRYQNGPSIQTHTASAARASAVTTSAARATAHYVQRMKGGRFRRGGCVCVCQGMSKKRMDNISIQNLIQPSNHPT